MSKQMSYPQALEKSKSALSKRRENFWWVSLPLVAGGAAESFLVWGPIYSGVLEALVGAIVGIPILVGGIDLILGEYNLKTARKVFAASERRWRELVPTAEDGPLKPQGGFSVIEAFSEEGQGGQEVFFVAKVMRWSERYGRWERTRRLEEADYQMIPYSGKRHFKLSETPFAEITEALVDFYFAVMVYNRERYAAARLEEEAKGQLKALPRFRQVISG